MHTPSNPTSSGIGRRTFLQVSATATASLALTPFFGESGLSAVERDTKLPIIVLFMVGGPPSKETFAPDESQTPSELRGPFNSIETRTGNRFCALFPELARRSDQFALLKAIDSESAAHYDAAANAMAPNGKKALPARWGDQAVRGGLPASLLFMPSGFSEMYSSIAQDTFLMNWDDRTGRFVPPSFKPDPRLSERRQLLEAFDTNVPPSPASQRIDRFRESAFTLLQGGGRFAEAFHLPENDRRRYGNTRYGDAVLLSKRMVERGAGVVAVHDQEGSGWDMHGDLQNRMRIMGPRTDMAVAALIDDLTEEQLECVVVLMGEFNRTPRINASGGRDHWPEGTTALITGGRIRKGVVHGRMDALGRTCDGMVKAKETVANTILLAAGAQISPEQPRVREILQ